MKKIIYQLPIADRADMMEKVMTVTREKLFERKANGLKFKEMAAVMGIPKTRMSEIFRQRYLGERTLYLLVIHGFLSPADILPELTDEQKEVFTTIIQGAIS